jgi:hypothetical protein
MAEAKIKTAYDIADESNLPIDIVSQPALLLLLLLLQPPAAARLLGRAVADAAALPGFALLLSSRWRGSSSG